MESKINCVFYINLVPFSDDWALFNTRKLPSGFRVLTFRVSSGWVGKNIDFSSIGRVRVAEKSVRASGWGSIFNTRPITKKYPKFKHCTMQNSDYARLHILVYSDLKKCHTMQIFKDIP